jgi:hypothetical protein
MSPTRAAIEAAESTHDIRWRYILDLGEDGWRISAIRVLG